MLWQTRCWPCRCCCGTESNISAHRLLSGKADRGCRSCSRLLSPPIPHNCLTCGLPLVKRANERVVQFNYRTHCDQLCYHRDGNKLGLQLADRGNDKPERREQSRRNMARLWQDGTMEEAQNRANNRSREVPRPPLSDEEVRQIRADRRPQEVIAVAFGISEVAVWRIKNLRAYSHIDGPQPFKLKRGAQRSDLHGRVRQNHGSVS